MNLDLVLFIYVLHTPRGEVQPDNVFKSHEINMENAIFIKKTTMPVP